MTLLKTIFMGSDPIVLPLLEALVKRFSDQLDVIAVYTQPDRRSGRGMKLKAGPVKVLAQDLGLEVRQPECMNEDEYLWLREQGCELILVMAYGQILKQELLDLPSHAILNFHASILPSYRGASPLEGAISAGEKETGVTLMQIIRELDAGSILDVEKVAIEPDMQRDQLADKLAAACIPLLERNISSIAGKVLDFTPQDSERATFTRILTKDDSLLDFRFNASDLYNRICALAGWPGTAFEVNGDRIKAKEIRAVDGEGCPGEILSADKDGLTVACRKGALRFMQLQRPGGRMMSVGDFLRGYPLNVGQILDSSDIVPLVGNQPFPYRKRRKN